MEQPNLRYDAALAAFSLIAKMMDQDLARIGVLDAEMKLVAGPIGWDASHKITVLRVLESCLNGASDILGLGRIKFPVEFQATALCYLVNPINIRLATIWLADHGGIGGAATEYAGGSQAEPCTSTQLFNLCFLLYGSERGTIERQKFELRMGLAQQEAQTLVTKGK